MKESDLRKGDIRNVPLSCSFLTPRLGLRKTLRRSSFSPAREGDDRRADENRTYDRRHIFPGIEHPDDEQNCSRRRMR